MQLRILSVSELNQYIKRVLTNDPILFNLKVQGEISNFKHHNSGHMYFTLKDEGNRISCVMFKSNAKKLKFKVKEGMKVTLAGYISIFERDGQYQLYANSMEPMGVGALYLAFQQLKEKLEKEGLFDKTVKKKLPYLPKKIGVITSPTGAAIRDILSIITRRFPNIHIVVYPVLVQGEGAAKDIASAINKANLDTELEVLIVGRGGGSIEELWAFNEEIVARSIYRSRIPVISAVGHETDFTIADFVADLRAPTPSAAAELAVPEYRELILQLEIRKRRLELIIKNRLNTLKDRLKAVETSYPFKYPMDKINTLRQNLDTNYQYLCKAMAEYPKELRKDLLFTGERLNTLSPLSVLSRGFAVAMKTDGRILRSVKDIQEDEDINLRLRDGEVTCLVKEIKVGKIES
ncbi:exodeoxyribonuclease VII large subunit [Alkaliphilus serpentinus]|uniref:Exodeoxyribonuclease 7 large subunit n=1 Tax=Alkaliphilus serpentinus TaxID=1482731 RepID=A0A833HME3_9FIRM|nr:exodeoxyribonuclease VII large subunit [Alkaliphilus serpentinus]KAB3527568.1 exodeoxyribonuclease VII large subunit [Alkaliphilus serpentinus]